MTNSWVKEHLDYLTKIGLKPDKSNIGEIINKAGQELIGRYMLSDVSYYRRGPKLYGGPLWAGVAVLW